MYQDNLHRHHKLQRLEMSDLDLLDNLKEAVGEQTGEKITVLYASETGNTAELAKNVAYELKRRSLRCNVKSFDDVDIMDLPKLGKIICLSATCGQGEFP